LKGWTIKHASKNHNSNNPHLENYPDQKASLLQTYFPLSRNDQAIEFHPPNQNHDKQLVSIPPLQMQEGVTSGKGVASTPASLASKDM
jgi:hypothetical protein